MTRDRERARQASPAFVRRVLAALTRAQGPVRWRREDPVVCLVGTILAQATTDVQAEQAYRELRRRFPTWAGVLDAPRRDVAAAIRSSGLSAQKARAIQAFLGHLKETRGGFTLAGARASGQAAHARAPAVEPLLAELVGIPGVGIKTAAITLMFGFGADLCAVDTHLVRILRRLRIVSEKAAPDRAFRILRPLVPGGRGVALHLQLIRFGRQTCRALRPRCGACPIRAICPYPAKTPHKSCAM